MTTKCVEICECGHTKDSHSVDHKGLVGYCKEYIYNNFEMKCRCQQYIPYMVLDKEEDMPLAHALTGEDDVLLETI